MLSGCKSNSVSDTASPTDYTVDKSFIAGIAEPNTLGLTFSKKVSDITTLLQSLGAKTYLDWVNISETMTTETDVNADVVNRHNNFHKDAGYAGIKRIVAVSQDWLMPDEIKDKYKGYSIPHRDMTDGSDYRMFLTSFQTQWNILVKSMSEVRYWQVGYEWNLDEYLHPMEYSNDKSKVFTDDEKAAIITDMMYAASSGIHNADKYAVVIMPAIAQRDSFNGTTAASFLEKIYSNIDSGKFGNGSTTVEDYFQVLSWNPVITDEPDETWVKANESVYNVAKAHGDDGRSVYLSRFGYSGDDTVATEQGKWMAKAYQLTNNSLPFVETLFMYRCFNNDKGVASQKNAGMFLDISNGLVPTGRALELQTAWNGNGDLKEFIPDANAYKSGENLAREAYVEASSTCQHWDWGWDIANITDGDVVSPSGWITWYEGEHPFHTIGEDGNGALTEDYNEWLLFTLPVATTINQVNLVPRYFTDYNGQNYPREFQILVSEDGVVWTQVGAYELTTFGKNLYKYPFESIKAKYVKLNFTRMMLDEGTGSYHIALREVEIIKS